MAVTVAAASDALNQFAVQEKMEISQKLRQGLEFESMLTPRSCDNTYSAPNAAVTDVIQPYQWQFTHKGDVTLDAVDNKLVKIKVDILLTADDLEKFWNTYMVEWHEVGKDPMEWNFGRYMFDEVYLPKIIEEMNKNAWSGVYAAPTAGTAGTSVGSVDGYAKKIADAVTAGDLTEYATGVWVDNTVVSQVESWVDSLPTPYRDAPGEIIMSNTLAKKYWRNYRSEFGTGNGVAGNANTELRVDATNKTIRAVNAMEGSNRILFSPASAKNMIWGTRTGYDTYFNLRWLQTDARVIKGTAEIYRFYGFEFWDHLFVNDQV